MHRHFVDQNLIVTEERGVERHNLQWRRKYKEGDNQGKEGKRVFKKERGRKAEVGSNLVAVNLHANLISFLRATK